MFGQVKKKEKQDANLFIERKSVGVFIGMDK